MVTKHYSIKHMKYFFSFILLVTGILSASAQEQQTAKLLMETARTLVQKGDFDNAVLILERARQQEPDNAELLRDLTYNYYLKRDFGKAIEVGKALVEKPTADQQSFQVLGLAYKAIASYKECGKLYRTALRQFPNSGVIYNEYAELFAMENELDEAIAQWEKGIEVDPSYSSNYYNAAIFYNKKNNWIRAALYSEIFLNLESYTARTTEIKTQLSTAWKNLLIQSNMQQLKEAKATSAFEKNVLDVLSKVLSNTKGNGTIDDLVSLRANFLTAWAESKQKNYPFQLFTQHQYLVKQGLFGAYNYWLFTPSADAEAYKTWQSTHAKEADGFTAFQQSRVFKLPQGEYYFSK